MKVLSKPRATFKLYLLASGLRSTLAASKTDYINYAVNATDTLNQLW
jgi:hypothetical protein